MSKTSSRSVISYEYQVYLIVGVLNWGGVTNTSGVSCTEGMVEAQLPKLTRAEALACLEAVTDFKESQQFVFLRSSRLKCTRMNALRIQHEYINPSKSFFVVYRYSIFSYE